jgi:hypothetical protein
VSQVEDVSNPEVASMRQRLQYLIDWMDAEGHLLDHCFEFPDGENWWASRQLSGEQPADKVARALAYDVWNYSRPNEAAVHLAELHIKVLEDAAEIAGFKVEFVGVVNDGHG